MPWQNPHAAEILQQNPMSYAQMLGIPEPIVAASDEWPGLTRPSQISKKHMEPPPRRASKGGKVGWQNPHAAEILKQNPMSYDEIVARRKQDRADMMEGMVEAGDYGSRYYGRQTRLPRDVHPDEYRRAAMGGIVQGSDFHQPIHQLFPDHHKYVKTSESPRTFGNVEEAEIKDELHGAYADIYHPKTTGVKSNVDPYVLARYDNPTQYPEPISTDVIPEDVPPQVPHVPDVPDVPVPEVPDVPVPEVPHDPIDDILPDMPFGGGDDKGDVGGGVTAGEQVGVGQGETTGGEYEAGRGGSTIAGGGAGRFSTPAIGTGGGYTGGGYGGYSGGGYSGGGYSGGGGGGDLY